jgi:hypothetical protein
MLRYSLDEDTATECKGHSTDISHAEVHMGQGTQQLEVVGEDMIRGRGYGPELAHQTANFSTAPLAPQASPLSSTEPVPFRRNHTFTSVHWAQIELKGCPETLLAIDISMPGTMGEDTALRGKHSNKYLHVEVQ